MDYYLLWWLCHRLRQGVATRSRSSRVHTIPGHLWKHFFSGENTIAVKSVDCVDLDGVDLDCVDLDCVDLDCVDLDCVDLMVLI